jgi:hypothetical protein
MLDDPTMRYNSKWSTLYLLFHYVFPFNHMGMWWSYNGRWFIMIHLMLVFNMFSLCSLFLSLCISFNYVVVCDGDDMWESYNGKWLIVIHFYVLSLCCLLLSLFFLLLSLCGCCFHYWFICFHYVFPFTICLCEWKWYVRILQWEMTHGDPFLWAFTMWLCVSYYVIYINYVVVWMEMICEDLTMGNDL